MMDHVQTLRPEDYDDFDESQVEVHEGHPVKVILSVPIEDEDLDALSDVGDREGKTIIEDAMHAYAVAHTGEQRRAS